MGVGACVCVHVRVCARPMPVPAACASCACRYQPLHAHLRAGAMAVAGVPGGMLGGAGPGGPQRRLLATLLEYVCYQDSEEVQVRV